MTCTILLFSNKEKNYDRILRPPIETEECETDEIVLERSFKEEEVLELEEEEEEEEEDVSIIIEEEEEVSVLGSEETDLSGVEGGEISGSEVEFLRHLTLRESKIANLSFSFGEVMLPRTDPCFTNLSSRLFFTSSHSTGVTCRMLRR